MQFKELESLIAVVECRSFSEAALQLQRSQPTISTHINLMEKEFHRKLVIRSTKQLEITPYGVELYHFAVNTLNQVEALKSRWEDQGNRPITIGASTIPCSYFLPRILSTYTKERTSVTFTIKQGDSEEVISWMQNQLFDVGFIGRYYEDDLLMAEPFAQDELVVITPNSPREQNYPAGVPLSPVRLLSHPMILRELGSASGKIAQELFRTLRISESKIPVAARVNNEETIKNLVAAGMGIAIISKAAALNFVQAGRLLTFPLPRELGKRNLYLLRSKGEMPNHVRQFTEWISKEIFSPEQAENI